MWNTTTATNGTHTLSATTRDAAGNQTTSISISVTVSNIAPDTTAPSTPSSLTASAVSSSQINLSWGAATDGVGVTGYKLERCQGSSCTNYSEIAAPSGTSYHDTGLPAATTYRYRVRATDVARNFSGYSTSISGTTQATASTNTTISMLNNTYTPLNITITTGTTIVFRNDSSKDRWPASDSHPSHTIYPAFDSLQAIAPGASWSFTFQEAGQWGYHDHLQPGITGYITVQ
jgi:plastocyanin